MNQGGTADRVCFVHDRKISSVKDVFFKTILTEGITSKESFSFQRRSGTVVNRVLVALLAPDREFETR